MNLQFNEQLRIILKRKSDGKPQEKEGRRGRSRTNYERRGHWELVENYSSGVFVSEEIQRQEQNILRRVRSNPTKK